MTYLIYFLILVFLIGAEFLYSLYKKDSVHLPKTTLGNFVTGLIGHAKNSTFGLFLLSATQSYFLLMLSDYTVKKSFLLFTICFFLVDFIYYVLHVLHHNFKFLWIFHFVHHSDYKFNLSTSFRTSWIEECYIFLFFIPVLLIGVPVSYIVVSFIILSVDQYFSHEPYIKWPKFLELFLITPSNHRNHHDQKIPNQNTNFGAIFSIWDRMFGTYSEPIEEKDFIPGIKGYKQDNFIKIQTDPMVEYVRNLFGKVKKV